MKKYLFFIAVIVLFALSFSGCARSCESWNRDFQTGSRKYTVEVYSGGKLIRTFKFDGILNNQANSDGYFFSIGDTLYEVGGDVIVSSVD